jgi:two-component system cell cycle response regulator
LGPASHGEIQSWIEGQPGCRIKGGLAFYYGRKDMDIKVLLVDNEENIREALKYGLNSKGIFNIEEASNGMEALLKAIGIRPDIILLDVTMPVMDGIQAYKRLKENPETRHIPVILLTANPYKDILQEIKITVDEYLEKPCEIEKLFTRIKKVLSLGRSRDYGYTK